MSDDLFAAFGSSQPTLPDCNVDNQPSVWDQSQAHNGADSTTLRRDTTPEDDDDFGDFEDAAPRSVPKPAPVPVKKPNIPPANTVTPKPAFPPKKPPAAKPSPERVTGHHPFANHMDLLFAADEDEYDAGQDDLNVDLSRDPEAAAAYSKQLIEAQMRGQAQSKPQAKAQSTKKAAPIVEASTRQPNKLKKKSGYAPAKDTTVLFDADDPGVDSEADDDWGDFEASSTVLKTESAAKRNTAPPNQSTMSAIDLLALENTSASNLRVNSHNSANDQQERHAPKLATGSRRVPHATTQTSSDGLGEDAWDDFEEASAAPSRELGSDGNGAIPNRTSSNVATPANILGVESALPPTNVPPPAILLSIFPSMFASADEALFDTLAKLDLKQKQMLLAHPATYQFLRGYVNLAIVLAHVIAGRKYRWKRDQYLAQGMRIGPAAAGGKAGMKLAGVDKAETAKEDREVVDTVRLWRAQAGKLRTAVTAANAVTPDGQARLPTVPEVAEQMPIKVLKPEEGGIVAPHACALCGLRREERVAKVDVEVDDSFGEWWVQSMNMHLTCRNFWEEHHSKLRSR